jgi:hypothetical protein
MLIYLLDWSSGELHDSGGKMMLGWISAFAFISSILLTAAAGGTEDLYAFALWMLGCGVLAGLGFYGMYKAGWMNEEHRSC